MAVKKRRKKQPKQAPRRAGARGSKYTAGELFVAILGGAMLILFLGIVVTSILGK